MEDPRSAPLYASPTHGRPEPRRAPWLVVVQAGPGASLVGKSFSLSVTPFTIGRGGENSLVCASDSVSRHHASLVYNGHGWEAHDVSSVNGTFVNDERTAEARLRNGDRIRIGDIVLTYFDPREIEMKPRPSDARVASAGLLMASDAPEESIDTPRSRDEPHHAVSAEERVDAVVARVETHDALGAPAAERTDYRGADLRGADLSWKTLTNANFEGADLAGANLSGARLSGASFANANLSSASLAKANLANANLAGANVSGADFTNAYLERAKMRGAQCTLVKLRGANLRWADLSDAQFELARDPMPIRPDSDRHEVTMPGVMVCRADLSHANLEGADIRGANLGGARLTRANLRNVNLARAQLRNCDLFGANLRDADLRGVDARGAIFDGAWLACANLEAADLRGATFPATWLLGANLSGAKTSRSDFREARGSSSTRFPKQLNSLQFIESRLFSVKRAWALDRLFGMSYTFQAMASVDEPLVVLRYVGGIPDEDSFDTANRWSSDPRDGLTLLPFVNWLEQWAVLLRGMNFDPFRSKPVSQMLSIDGFDQLRAGHAPVISIAADAATAVILAAILKVTTGTQLTDEALSASAEAARASAFPLLSPKARGAAHLSDVTASGFYARCIRFVVESSARGCDVVVVV
jgi:uncharacterized protein YjbI with pentapeptide repeats